MFKQIVGKEICFGYETIRKARVCIYIMMEWDNTINKKSMIAMIGGVDSSVAAYLMQKQRQANATENESLLSAGIAVGNRYQN